MSTDGKTQTKPCIRCHNSQATTGNRMQTTIVELNSLMRQRTKRKSTTQWRHSNNWVTSENSSESNHNELGKRNSISMWKVASCSRHSMKANSKRSRKQRRNLFNRKSSQPKRETNPRGKRNKQRRESSEWTSTLMLFLHLHRRNKSRMWHLQASTNWWNSAPRRGSRRKRPSSSKASLPTPPMKNKSNRQRKLRTRTNQFTAVSSSKTTNSPTCQSARMTI